MTISRWPVEDRPRERLLNKGAESLSDAELLAIFLRTGVPGKSAVELSRELIAAVGGLRPLLDQGKDGLCQFKGVGIATYVQLQAALEVGRRYLWEGLASEPLALSSVRAVVDYLTIKLRHLEIECFSALYLDSQNQLIDYTEITRGTVNAAVVYPREVVKSALDNNAVSVIFAHNHPSGRATPSESDRFLTESLKKALKTVDVAVFDHIIIGDGEHFSFAEHGWL